MTDALRPGLPSVSAGSNVDSMCRVRVFMASSPDGFIAGPNDELDWLADLEGVEDTFGPFLAQIGALLMGRRTFDAVEGFAGDWPYGERPVLVATTRSLGTGRASVRGATGPIGDLVGQAKALAGERDVYLDGGALVRSALDAGLVDEVTLTLVPVVLGAGVPLFAGSARRHRLELLGARSIGGGLVQLRYVLRR